MVLLFYFLCSYRHQTSDKMAATKICLFYMRRMAGDIIKKYGVDSRDGTLRLLICRE